MSIFMKVNTCFLISLRNTEAVCYTVLRVHFHPHPHHNRYVWITKMHLPDLGNQLFNQIYILTVVAPTHTDFDGALDLNLDVDLLEYGE